MNTKDQGTAAKSGFLEKISSAVAAGVITTVLITIITSLSGTQVIAWLGGVTVDNEDYISLQADVASNTADIAKLTTGTSGLTEIKANVASMMADVDAIKNSTFQFGKTKVQFCSGEEPCRMGGEGTVPIIGGHARWELSPDDLPEGSRILNAWIGNIAGLGDQEIDSIDVTPDIRNLIVDISTRQEGLVIVNLDFVYLEKAN